MTNPETDLDEATMIVFWSLLGTLSWLQQTRADIAPFIGYLQRIAKKPNNEHIRMANKVLRYCRRVKTGLYFKKLTSPVRMVIVADSAYQANNDLTECLALRGYLIMIVGGQPSRSKFPGGHGYVLEWVSKTFNTITRSSFCAELRNQLEAAQSGVHFSTFMAENKTPFTSAVALAAAQDNNNLTLPAFLVGDNKGVFLAVSAQNPKVATEPTLTPHIRGIRELVDKGLISGIIWCDNRDMIADPLTKGKTKRNVLNDVLNQAEWIVDNPTETWPPLR